MDTRYCSVCVKKLSPPFFLRDASSLPSSKVFATCYICREKSCKKKRPALQEIDPNIGPPSARRRATSTSRAPFSPSVINQSPIPPVQPLLRPPPPVRPPVSPVQPSRPPPIQPPLPVQPQRVQPPPVPPPVQPPPPDSFLPADQ